MADKKIQMLYQGHPYCMVHTFHNERGSFNPIIAHQLLNINQAAIADK